MKLSDFDYELPEELIAQYPTEERGASRLMIIDRGRDEVRETRFSNLKRYLRDGDILVINETKVIPARLLGRKSTGGGVEVFLLRRIGDHRWTALLRPGRRLRAGETVHIGEQEHRIAVLAERGGGQWEVALPEDRAEMDFILANGRIPLPPYIKREDEDRDRERYQTVYASRPGSVAAPTAGLHFTEEILASLARGGVTVIPLTLHVGSGTFRPLESDTVEDNSLESEYVMIERAYLRMIEGARRQGRRVIAVGTTTTRALESFAADQISGIEERSSDGGATLAGWTNLFIYPGFDFRIVDGLLTNFHLPRSSLLLLVAAFAGREKILNAYAWAVKRRYRFYSYGDAMLIR
jgi:S-adenosylmethionine:tRNA ribosyltransferase-isomerase